MKVGYYNNISIADYHADKEWFSASGLKKAKRNLKDFKLYLDGYYDNQRQSHFDFGNAFELALLDASNFEENVCLLDDDKRPEPNKTYASTLNKAWKEEQGKGKYLISQSGNESFETIQKMLESCYQDAVIQKLIKGIEYQYSMFWIDEKTGLKLKSRPDICKTKKNIIVDLKTTRDGSPEAFSKDLANFDYPFQAIMQMDGVIQSGFMKQVDNYFWLVVEKEPPYSATIYEFDQEDIKQCRFEYEWTLNQTALAIEKGLFPSYSNRSENQYGILTAKIPMWYRNTF